MSILYSNILIFEIYLLIGQLSKLAFNSKMIKVKVKYIT